MKALDTILQYIFGAAILSTTLLLVYALIKEIKNDLKSK